MDAVFLMKPLGPDLRPDLLHTWAPLHRTPGLDTCYQGAPHELRARLDGVEGCPLSHR
jgi:hypothetical protein